MSLWTQRHIVESQKDIPKHIKNNKTEKRIFNHLCFWIELTSGKVDGTWLITYLTLELGLSYHVVQNLLCFNIPAGREICSYFHSNYGIGRFPDRVSEEKYKRSLLSRGPSNFGEFLASDIDELTPKELAEWFLKVNFEYPLLDCYPSWKINLGVEDLLNGKEVVDVRLIYEILKQYLKGKQDNFAHVDTSAGLQIDDFN